MLLASISRMILTDCTSYTGNLTYVLDSGLRISIDNSQFITPNRFLEFDGSISYNSSEVEVLIEDRPDDAPEYPILGQPFLSAAYLMVDNDAQTFTLWESVPQAKTDLVAVAPSKCDSSTSSTSTNTTSHGLPRSTIIPVATIIPLVFISLVAVATYYITLRRRSRN